MEMELGSGFGLTYRQNPSNDWECLGRFLECLQSSQGERVYLGVSEKEERKLPEEYKELILNWTEKGYQKPEEKPKKGNGGSGSGSNNHHNQDWSNLNPNFQGTEGNHWKERWIKAGFTYQPTKEWMDIGLKVIDFDFAHWLKTSKRKSPSWVLNHGNMEKLREEYESEQTYEM